MSAAPALAELLQLPFLQRALLAGLLTGALGGLLGSFAVLRQLSFFSDALGHSALLGISAALLLGLNPTLVLVPFAVLFALGIDRLSRRSRLPTDALLNIVYSSSLALAMLALSRLPSGQGGIEQLLFGDILGVGWPDLALLLLLLLLCGGYLLLSRRSQILLTLDEPLAISRGVAAPAHRLIFLVLLAVVVAISIKAVGVLLISAFVVIPACAARLLSGGFRHYVLLAMALGSLCAVGGLLLSALLDLPSGPAVVAMQLAGFLLALALASRRGSQAS
ncbi:MAG: metal ABC transporter permease [Cyanobacteriota bacterium]|nr:metal ABC transporter permease [Cyanobacteriota bacterium]